MIIKTQDFKEAADKILLASDLDKTAANLELLSTKDALFLSVTNKEFYVRVRFDLENGEDFRAVVDASLFLNLISGLASEEFSLAIDGNALVVSAGRSNYKLAMIYDNMQLMELPVIKIDSAPTVTMPISTEILTSILNVNRKELQKAKNLDVNELQKLYYIDETGCFTFTSGACLNSFTLEKPVKLLLNDRIVRLFKLFKSEFVQFSMGQDTLPTGAPVSKAVFENPNTYIAALITCDPVLLGKVQSPCNATKQLINSSYPNQMVFSAEKLLSAVNRLMLFTKNSFAKINTALIKVKAEFTADELTLTDNLGNTEVIPTENDSHVTAPYITNVNLTDLKFVLESCKNDFITVRCGNRRAITISRGTICNLIPEADK